MIRVKGSIDTGQSGLTTSSVVEIEDNIDSVSAEMYRNCALLEDASFPNATSVGDHAFRDCVALKEVDLPQVTTIGTHCFDNCTVLTAVNASNVTSIGASAFLDCGSLAFIDTSNLTALESETFRGCSSLTSVDTSQVVSIGPSVFYECTQLTGVDTSGVTSIGHWAFTRCVSLTEIDASNVETVGFRTFLGCTGIVTMSLPLVTDLSPLDDRSLIAHYEGAVFEDCTSLKKIVLPKVTKICGRSERVGKVRYRPTFKGCTSLATVIIGADENGEVTSSEVCELTGAYGFTDTPIASGTGYIYVPDDLVDSYKAANNWSTYASRIKPVSELT